MSRWPANLMLFTALGECSCRPFIGRTCELLGQRTEVAEYFRKALAEQPADHLAKAGLARVAV